MKAEKWINSKYNQEVESIQMSWDKMVVSGKKGIESGTQISVLGKRMDGQLGQSLRWMT